MASYAPSNLPDASDDLLQRVSMLYQGDAQLHGLWEQALATRTLTGDLAADNGRNAAATGALAARLMLPAERRADRDDRDRRVGYAFGAEGAAGRAIARARRDDRRDPHRPGRRMVRTR